MAYKFLKMVVLQKILKYVVEYYEKRFFGIFVFQQCLLFFLFALFLFYDHFPSSVRVEPVATKGYIFWQNVLLFLLPQHGKLLGLTLIPK